MTTRILLVEPSPTQAEMVRTVLKEAGYDVCVCSDAAAARFEIDRSVFQIVLTNYTLPDGTGPQLCQELAARARPDCLVVIAESGNAEQILESLASGADGFCIKTSEHEQLAEQVGRAWTHARSGDPVISESVRFEDRDYHLELTVPQWLDVLLSVLDDLSTVRTRCRELSRKLSDDRSPESGATSEDSSQSGTPVERKALPAGDPHALTVLLAEDSATNRVLASTLLKKAGYQVVAAGNGQEVLDLLEQDGPPIDFVLMDVEMPEMDGLEATRRLREREQGRDDHLTVLAMTALSADAEQRACLDAGMDGCLSKPLRIDDLERALQRVSAATPSPPGGA